jgi:hypothetical protein
MDNVLPAILDVLNVPMLLIAIAHNAVIKIICNLMKAQFVYLLVQKHIYLLKLKIFVFWIVIILVLLV